MLEYQQTVNSVLKHGALYRNMSMPYSVLKRLLDISVSLLGIIVLFPFTAAIVVVLKIKLKGLILVEQKIAGLGGHPVRIIMFKSEFLKIDISSLLNRLLQLLNVFKGEMSLVGPAPVSLNDMTKFSSWHSLRLLVKPGITGLWEINKSKSAGFEDMIRTDLKYIRERNFAYDLKILLRAIKIFYSKHLG